MFKWWRCRIGVRVRVRSAPARDERSDGVRAILRVGSVSEHALTWAQRANKQARRVALKDFAQLAGRTASAVDSAVIVGDLPSRARLAANRMARILSRLVKAGGDVSDVSGRMEHDLAGPAARLEAHCAAAGFALPEDNRDARG